MPVAPQPHPASSTAPHQLPRSSEPVRLHLVYEEIEFDPVAQLNVAPARRLESQRHAVAVFGGRPAALYHVRSTGEARDPARMQGPSLSRGNDQKSSRLLLHREFQIYLEPIGMDLVGLVVQQQGCGPGIPRDYVGLYHVDSKIQRLVVPVHHYQSGKSFRACVWVFAPTILILVIELKGLGRIKSRERAVQDRRLHEM